MLLSCVLVTSVLLFTSMAGCSGVTESTSTGRTFQRPIAIQETWGVRVGDRIDWHFRIHNGGDARGEGLSLHMTVSFNQPGFPQDWAEQDLPSMGPGATQEVILATPFHGFGDYAAFAEVWQGGLTVARGQAGFEQCAAC